MGGFILPLYYEQHKCSDRQFGERWPDGQPVGNLIDKTPTSDLPSSCPATEAYVANALALLSQFSWIYDVQLTNLFTGSTLQQIPADWSLYLRGLSLDELNDVPSDSNMPGMPNSLSAFISACCRLSLPRGEVEGLQPLQLPRDFIKGMNPKKRHEVARMSALVTSMSCRSNCPLVVDVGAGLGYLSAEIARHPSLRVLALECREMLTHGTETRGIDQGLKEDLDALTFNLQDNEDNFKTLREILSTKLKDCAAQGCLRSQLLSSIDDLATSWTHSTIEDSPKPQKQSSIEDQVTSQTHTTAKDPATFQNPIPAGSPLCTSQMHNSTEDPTTSQQPFLESGPATSQPCTASGDPAASYTPGICLMGLHCCGSLTPTMMKLYTSTPEIRSFVCVSCCYHSLHQQPDKTWTHFPMSQIVRSILESKLPDFTVSVFGMRLAAQETRSRWMSQTAEDHEFHRNNVGFRALLQLICQQEGLSIGKEKRHIAKRKAMASLDTYVAAVLGRTGLGRQCPDIEQRLRALHTEYTQNLALIEPFTSLQVALQPVLESLVLVDRVLFLREAGIEARLVPIFSDLISPRNIAIVAEKRHCF